MTILLETKVSLKEKKEKKRRKLWRMLVKFVEEILRPDPVGDPQRVRRLDRSSSERLGKKEGRRTGQECVKDKHFLKNNKDDRKNQNK